MTAPMTAPPVNRPLAYTLFALAAALAVNTVLGPVFTDGIRYRMSATLVNQLIALDVTSLVLIAPLCALAGVLVLRGHVAGPVLATGPAAFTVYMTAQTILGSDYLGVAGNNERWFPWHLGLFVLGTATLVLALSGIEPERLPQDTPASRRWIAGALFGLVGFIVLVQWLPVLADITGGQPTRADYLESPTMTWTIVLLDLGIAVPAAVAAGVGLLRRAAWARTAAYAAIGFFALVGPAVAAMAITMQVNDDPNASAGNVVLMTLVGLLLAGLGVAVYRPLLRPETTAAEQPPTMSRV